MATHHCRPTINPVTLKLADSHTNAPPRLAPFGDNTLSVPAMVTYSAILEHGTTGDAADILDQRGIDQQSIRLALYELDQRGHLAVQWEKVYPETTNGAGAQ